MFNIFNLFGGPFAQQIQDNFNKANSVEWIKPIVEFLDRIIWPLTIIVAIVGAIWVIWLGIKMAKAEEASKQKEARKALINVAIAMLVTLIIVWLLTWFAANLSAIFDDNKPFSDLPKTAFKNFLKY